MVKNIWSRMLSAMLSAVLICALVPAVALADDTLTAGEPNVDKHSASEISDYYQENVVTKGGFYQAPVFDVNPQTTQPYALGKVSQGTLDQALATLNFIRYVAGLDDVTLDDEYTTQAQGAALINAINGQLGHYPTKPEGMTEEMYETCYSGASKSNLSAGRSSLGSSLIDGWLDDSDSSNIFALGHRRWILNPSMGKTGFGIVSGSGISSLYSSWMAMYAIDCSNSRASQSNVTWPAQVTPVELFDDSNAWSLSTDENTLDISKIKVTVKRSADGKVWNFSQESSDGDFYVDNIGYGQGSCVIFRPKDLSIGVNDCYEVSVTGIANPVSYTVNFFSLNESDTTGGSSSEEPSDDPSGNQPGEEPGDNTGDQPGEEPGGDQPGEEPGDDPTGDQPGEEPGEQPGEQPGTDPSGEQGGTSTGDSTQTATTQTMYRLYNPNSGEHFYTANAGERDMLKGLGWNDEGTGWIAPTTGDPVYRLYNPNAGEHHYTTNASEKAMLERVGWNYEGIGWYSGGDVRLYREYNPNAYANNHNYTTNKGEHDWLLSLGWNDEGYAWNAVAVG